MKRSQFTGEVSEQELAELEGRALAMRGAIEERLRTYDIKDVLAEYKEMLAGKRYRGPKELVQAYARVDSALWALSRAKVSPQDAKVCPNRRDYVEIARSSLEGLTIE